MKTCLTTFILFFFLCFSYAQNEQSNTINYQAVAKDASGYLITNTNLAIQIALKFGSSTVQASYIENHTVTTNANGIFSIEIGTGTVVSGNYDVTYFGTDASYLTISINGTEVGTTEFNAVPYALASADNPWINNLGLVELKNPANTIITGNIESSGTISASEFDIDNSGNSPTINKFSDDVTLINSSSTSLPTENAVKTYVDNAFSNQVDSIDDLDDGKVIGSSIYLGLNAGSADTGASIGQNIGIGTEALETNTSGTANIAIGSFTLLSNTNGIENIAMGINSLQSNTIGNGNIAIGLAALRGNTVGNNNTALGTAALFANTSGSRNVALGYRAGFNELGSDKLYIANSDTSTPLIYGDFTTSQLRINGDLTMNTDVQIGSADFTLRSSNDFFGGMYVDSPDNSAGKPFYGYSIDGVAKAFHYFDQADDNWKLFMSSIGTVLTIDDLGDAVLLGSLFQNSDRRLKKDIETLPYGLNEVIKLEPKFYNWKNKNEEHKSFGLIAQEVREIIKEVVTIQDDDQQTLAISYIELIPVLINAIKEQQSQIESLKSDNKTKDMTLNQVLNRLDALEKMVVTSKNDLSNKN